MVLPPRVTRSNSIGFELRWECSSFSREHETPTLTGFRVVEGFRQTRVSSVSLSVVPDRNWLDQVGHSATLGLDGQASQCCTCEGPLVGTH
jgi:hypothetical protein